MVTSSLIGATPRSTLVVHWPSLYLATLSESFGFHWLFLKSFLFVFLLLAFTGFYWVFIWLTGNVELIRFLWYSFARLFLYFISRNTLERFALKKKKRKKKKSNNRGVGSSRGISFRFFFCPHFWIFLLKKKNGNRPRFPTIFSPFFFCLFDCVPPRPFEWKWLERQRKRWRRLR